MTTATMPDKCPRCGADAVGDDHVIGGDDYVCGTIVVRQGDRRVVADGEVCLRRQLQRVDAEATRLGEELTSAVLENERLRSALQRLYEDTVTPEVGCHRCAGAAGAHDEGCAMAEVEAVLGVEVPDDDDDA